MWEPFETPMPTAMGREKVILRNEAYLGTTLLLEDIRMTLWLLVFITLPAPRSDRQIYPESRECKRRVWTASHASSVDKDATHNSCIGLQEDMA